MAIFCGVDIVEIERLKKSIDDLESFRNRIFTKGEIDYCEKGTRRNMKATPPGLQQRSGAESIWDSMAGSLD